MFAEEALDAAKGTSERITQLEIDHAAETDRIIEQRRHVDNIRGGVMQAVIKARDESDPSKIKPKFSNELARQTELEERLSVNSVYRDAAATLANMEMAHQVSRITIDAAHRDFQIARLTYEAVAIGRRN